MTATETTIAEVAETIAAHIADGRRSYITAVCVCGWRGSWIDHPRHVAEAIADEGLLA